jgi:NADH-quinone oxidoreductase subunit H
MPTPKLTLPKLLEKFNIVHPDRYDYSLVIDPSTRGYSDIVCKLHGAFRQRNSAHLLGQGCKKCRNSAIGDRLRFTKEDFIPNTPNKFLFILGPGIAMTTALMTSAVIPWGKPINLFGYNIDLQVADINIAILYVFGVISIGVYGIMIGGWASNNKFSLLGAVRASSQMISYEVAMGLSIIAVLMVVGSLSLKDIANYQNGFIDWNGKFPFFSWLVFKQPIAFLIFLICAFAETNRTPFDLPECESELVGGYHTEYSSMKLGFFLFSEYVNMFISSTIISTLFFGGYNYPVQDYVSHTIH